MSPEASLIVAAIFWSIASTVVAQVVSIGVMWWLGLPPKKLAHEIEDVQNPAVGASFFIISLAAGLFVGILTSDGFDAQQPDFLSGALWIGLGLMLGLLLMMVSFWVAHRALDRVEGESVYRYIQRELIEEQNVSLAFFLGGLSITAFIAVIFQVI